MSLRICFVVSESPVPPRNGVTRKTYELIGALSRIADIDVVSFDRHDPKGGPVEVERDLAPGRRAISLPYGRGRLPWQRYRIKLLREAVFLLGMVDYDVVHLDTLMLGHLRTAFLPSAVGVWSLNDSRSHALGEAIRSSRSPRNRAALSSRRIVAQALETRLGPRFDFIDVVADAEASHLRELGLADVRVLPLGKPDWPLPDKHARHRRNKSDRARIGIMSSIGNYGSSVGQFIRESWPFIIGTVDAELIVVGSLERASPSLKTLLKSDTTVQHIEYAPSRLDFLAGIDMSVVPMAVRTGLPTKAIESIAAGVPVVGMQQLRNLPSKWEGLAFASAETYADLGRLAASILSDRDRLRSMQNDAVEMATEWPSWSSIADRYVSEAVECLTHPR